MNYKIAICDDEQSQTEYISSLVSAWARENDYTCDVSVFPSAEAFLFEYEDNGAFDILLLDVEFKRQNASPAGLSTENITGIELAKRIRRDKAQAEIIFITSHFEFIGEGYEVDALHYLVKPISADKLSAVLTKAAERLRAEPPSVIITCEGKTFKLPEYEILYVESFLHYIVIHTKEKAYRIKENISTFEKALSGDFYRIHRSYLVSLKHITRISRTSVNVGNTEFPLSRGKYDDINRAFIEHN